MRHTAAAAMPTTLSSCQLAHAITQLSANKFEEEFRAEALQHPFQNLRILRRPAARVALSTHFFCFVHFFTNAFEMTQKLRVACK
jgi:hypothetical protein